MEVRSSQAFTAVLENQNVFIQEKARSSAISFPYITCVVLLSLLVARVWMKVETTRLGYRLGELREKHTALSLDRQELELQFSVVKKPNSLYTLAHERLGMVSPVKDQVLKIR